MWRFRGNLALATAVVISLAAGSAFSQERDSAPPYFRDLIDTANVRFTYYEARQTPYRHVGYTTFRLIATHKYTYQIRWQDRGGRRHVTIRPKLGEFKVEVDNEVRLPRALDRPDRWSRPLVRHEFDHVAITVDPRLRMLAEHLFRELGPLTPSVVGGTRIEYSWVDAVIDEEIRPRRDAITKLLHANEELFDEKTRHGLVPLRDRRAFFQSLFTLENLEKQKFPYVREVRGLIARREYREAELPYRWDFEK